MKRLHLFSARRLWLGVGALITSAGLAVGSAGAQSPSTDSDHASDQPAASTTTKTQDADRENSDSPESQNNIRKQDRDRSDARNRSEAQNRNSSGGNQISQNSDAHRRAANQRSDRANERANSRRNDSADSDPSDQAYNDSEQSHDESAQRDHSNRDQRNQNANRNDNQGNRAQRRDQRQYSARPDASGQWQAGPQNAGGRQRFGVTWADDDEHWTVEEVAANSIAARAGLRTDDEVISLNGRQIGSSRDFQRYLSSNQRVPLVVIRDGRRQTIWLGGNQHSRNQFNQNQYSQNQFDQSYSQSAGQSSDAHAFLGVQLDDQYQSMAVVKQVYQNSPAQQAGLRAGDTITSVNGQRVSSPQELTDEVQQLQPGNSVQIQFSRPQARTVQIRLGQRSAEVSQASYQANDQASNQDRSRSRNGSQNRHDDSDDSSDQEGQYSQD